MSEKSKSNKPCFVIDGNNVVFTQRKKKGELRRLLVLMETLQQIGDVYSVVSASLKHRIDDRKTLEQLISQDRILETPPRVDADRYMLEITKQLEAVLVSNDLFQKYQNEYSDIIGSCQRFMFMHDRKGTLKLILPWIHQFRRLINAKKSLHPSRTQSYSTKTPHI